MTKQWMIPFEEQPMHEPRQSTIRFQRWYDQIPDLGLAINIMEKLSLSHQLIIAQAISRSVTSFDSRKTHIKEVGPDKLLGLLKSERKLRWYDKHQDIHRAFNEFYVLEGAEFQLTAIRVILSIFQLDNKKDISREEATKPVDDIFLLDIQALMRIGSRIGIDISKPAA
jgi:hypothetical protein